MVIDWMSMERRLQRDEDTPYLQLLREVQRSHTESITKLTDAVTTITTTAAVQATTLQIISKTQQDHQSSIDEMRRWREEYAHERNTIDISNVEEHSEMKGALRLLAWGVPVIISAVSVIAIAFERLVFH